MLPFGGVRSSIHSKATLLIGIVGLLSLLLSSSSIQSSYQSSTDDNNSEIVDDDFIEIPELIPEPVICAGIWPWIDPVTCQPCYDQYGEPVPCDAIPPPDNGDCDPAVFLSYPGYPDCWPPTVPPNGPVMCPDDMLPWIDPVTCQPCYDQYGEPVPCDAIPTPDNGNCDGDIFQTSMFPQIDPVTCEPICYGPLDERIPCDAVPTPDDGNGNCDGDIFQTSMFPQIDPVTCEPICYGPLDERIPCNPTTTPFPHPYPYPHPYPPTY
jgi:hypothetical protein